MISPVDVGFALIVLLINLMLCLKALCSDTLTFVTALVDPFKVTSVRINHFEARSEERIALIRHMD